MLTNILLVTVISHTTIQHHKKHKTSSHNRIIPPEEDMRRLFTECKIGQGNASLLSQAIMMRKPEDMKSDIIKVTVSYNKIVVR